MSYSYRRAYNGESYGWLLNAPTGKFRVLEIDVKVVMCSVAPDQFTTIVGDYDSIEEARQAIANGTEERARHINDEHGQEVK